MSNKGKSPTTTNVTPEDLRRVAEMIRRYSEQYDVVASEIENAGLESIPATGFKALENNALKLIRGHANKLKSTVQQHADTTFLSSLTSDYAKKVGEATASEKPLKKMPKRKGG